MNMNYNHFWTVRIASVETVNDEMSHQQAGNAMQRLEAVVRTSLSAAGDN